MFLVAVNWCYTYGDYDLYVVDLTGGVWPLFAAGPPEVRWLGDAWAVITDFGHDLHQVRLYLVADRDGGWAQIYDSEWSVSDGGALMRNLQGLPELAFEDGYRLLTVKRSEESGGIVKVYEWQDGGYVPVEERKLGDEPGRS